MRYRFALLILLLLPTTCRATLVATTEFNGGACTGNHTNEGEFTAGASFACPLASASASADILDGSPFGLSIHVVGGTPSSGLPPIRATASFDELVLVVGTDQPGFLLLIPSVSLQVSQATPSRIQFSMASLMG